jgi:oligopeptide/dipeptide ABC transporter ATP-binding protein
MPDEEWEELVGLEGEVASRLVRIYRPLMEEAKPGDSEGLASLCRRYGLGAEGSAEELWKRLADYGRGVGIILVQTTQEGAVIDAATGEPTYYPERSRMGHVRALLALRLKFLEGLREELKKRGEVLAAPADLLTKVERLIALKAKYDLLSKPEEYMRLIRGNYISMIFQEPMQALNPVIPVGEQIAESIILHQLGGEFPSRAAAVLHRIPIIGPRIVRHLDRARWAKAMVQAAGMLKMVRIPEPKTIAKAYPYELSGGMQQRVLIAMALATRPKLLIADEPTTALDVTIQAQILELMKELKEKTGTSILLITHDLGVVAEMCHRVCVMYAGRVVESGEIHEIFKHSAHPYTQGLVAAIPRPGVKVARLETIKGSVPNLIRPPAGCRFHPRCPYAMRECTLAKPEDIAVDPDHLAACILYRVDRPGGQAVV